MRKIFVRMSINERLQSIIDSLYKGNKRAFAISIGVSPTVIENVVGTRKGKPSYDVLEKICVNANVSSDWLLMGKGDMLKNDILPISNNVVDAMPLNIKSANMGKPIPLVHQFAVAGFGNSDFSIAEQDVKEYYVIPKFKYCKVDFMIEVHGSSMYPKYNAGDVIACTILRESKFIQWNKCHVIATQEQGILVKRIKKAPDPNQILAVSDNKDYDPFPIPVDEITGMALVVGVVRIE